MLTLLNARGVPGTAAARVRTPEGRRGLLTCAHVLFGGGCARGEVVWALVQTERGARRVALGLAQRGWMGRVTWRGEAVFIDCALVLLPQALPSPLALEREPLAGLVVSGQAPPCVGMRVCKRGATDITEGTIVEIGYDSPCIEGQIFEAPGQMRIRAQHGPFSRAGDSGAGVLDEDGRLIGLLWGASAAEGMACPVGPALEHLELELEGGC